MEEPHTIINMDRILEQRKLNPRSPWKVARGLEYNKQVESWTIEDVYNRAILLPTARDRCLFAILYLCAARIEEIVRYTPIRYGTKLVKVLKGGKVKEGYITDYSAKRVLRNRIRYSIKKKDITFDNTGDRPVIKFNIRNLKNRQREFWRKIIPLPLKDNSNPLDDKSKFNRMFARLIDIYVSPLDEDEELFPITPRRAEQILAKVGINPHFLRKVRLTHLVKLYNFSDQKLRFFAGWSDSRPSKDYIKLGVSDLINSM